jgi:hypothetical protein
VAKQKASLGDRTDSTTALADETFRYDDKLLASLQKLGHDIPAGHPARNGNLDKTKELCAMLIKYEVEGIRARLDRIYVEALHAPGHADEGPGGDALSLQHEVDSLYAEILPVAQMSAEKDYLDPTTQLIIQTARREGAFSDKAFAYVRTGVIRLVTLHFWILTSLCRYSNAWITSLTAHSNSRIVLMSATRIGRQPRKLSALQRQNSLSMSNLYKPSRHGAQRSMDLRRIDASHQAAGTPRHLYAFGTRSDVDPQAASEQTSRRLTPSCVSWVSCYLHLQKQSLMLQHSLRPFLPHWTVEGRK